LAALIVALAPSYDAFVAPATSRFKNVMPRVAALLDCHAGVGNHQGGFARPPSSGRIYAGTPSRP